MSSDKKSVGVIVHPVRMELFKLYEQMGKPQLTTAVLAEMREKLFPLELFKEVFDYHSKIERLNYLCDKNNAKYESRRCCFGGSKSGFYVCFTPNFDPSYSERFIGTTLDEAISWMEDFDKKDFKEKENFY